jgi:ABC-type nitrate/sulfonate/bicarbonate transport system substrate-binding protein
MAALIAGAAVLALGAAACGGTSGSSSGVSTPGSNSVINVTLGYVPYSDDASLFYAQDSGIFRKHGLNVSFVAQASPVAIEASMASGTE